MLEFRRVVARPVEHTPARPRNCVEVIRAEFFYIRQSKPSSTRGTRSNCMKFRAVGASSL